MAFQLLTIAGPDQGKSYTLQEGPDLMLGRGEKSIYRLSDPRVSRAHCQILLQGDVVKVIDNASTAGMSVNGEKGQEFTLEPGDVIRIGDTQLRLVVGDFKLEDVVAAGPARAGGTNSTGVTSKTPPLRNAALEDVLALTGTVLSHYAIGAAVGQGENGVVFKAGDSRDGTTVALKVLRPEMSQDEDDMQRFVRGMKTALTLKHPNLIAVLNAGKTGPFCWTAMEYVSGETMVQVIKRIGVADMLDWRYAFRVAVHVGRALEYAHGQQIVHRNVMPNNIMLQESDKTVKLGDLFLAKALEGANAKQVTRPGELVGEVAFMSPERTRGMADIDGRSDLYQLGATLYALLTGRPPFEGSTLVETITRIRQSEPVKPSKYQMSVPSEFEGVVLKLLAKTPGERVQSAADLLRELKRIGMMHNLNV